jgi:hypothetical protein
VGITDDEYKLLNMFVEQSKSKDIRDVVTEGSIYDSNYAISQAQQSFAQQGIEDEDISERDLMEEATKCTTTQYCSKLVVLC